MYSNVLEKIRILVNRIRTGIRRKPGRSLASRCRLAAGLAVFLAGCSVFPSVRSSETSVENGNRMHARFVEDNLALLNRVYSRSYEPSRFIVDTDSGSTPIQELIDWEAVRRIRRSVHFETHSDIAAAESMLAYLHRFYRYIPEPQDWVPVAETIRRKSGNCKNLSLLLLALLTVSGLESYAGISNGHMWVNAWAGQRWIVLETDPDAEGNAVYKLPGFYADPLFKIYPEYSLKRRKIERPS